MQTRNKRGVFDVYIKKIEKQQGGKKLGPVQIVLTVVLLAGLIFIYKKSNETEELLGLKLFGYYFLGCFRLNINQIAIPLGFLIYLIALHPQVNFRSKRQAAVLGLIFFLIGVAQPAIANYLFQRPIEVKTETAGLYDCDFAKDWQAMKQKFELPDDTKLEDFYAGFEEDGNIRELRYKLICWKDGGLVYYDVNLNKKRKAYVIRRSKLDQWLQYGHLVTASRFFDIVAKLNIQEIRPEKAYAWYCLASEGLSRVFSYAIKDHRIFTVDDEGVILPLSQENLPVNGYYISVYGMSKIGETSYQGEGYQDYFFDMVK